MLGKNRCYAAKIKNCGTASSETFWHFLNIFFAGIFKPKFY